MNELDDDGVAVYRGLGLRTILDLRRDEERRAAPTPRFGDERTVHISVSIGDTSFAEAAAHADDPATADRVLATSAGYYRSIVGERLPRWRPVLATVFEAAGEPVLFHCTAGKDRTGFLAAALLKFLDVDDATVFDDFTLTNRVRRPWVDQRVEFHRRRMADEQGVDPADVDPTALDAWRTLMSAPVELLHETFATVDREFGDWHTLRREGLGIGDERLAAWRSTVVET